ncbi:MAG: amidohydrolase family protein [Woeseiaceae bacterium]|nr:amidohydrolase family protein [Woeseiaceae bacterium]
MFDALVEAAADAGIRLTYVPVLYERGGFDDAPLSPAQARFRHGLDEFLAHYRRCRDRATGTVRVGIGAHSLRAVREDSLATIAAVAADDDVPMHVHIAEQRREVEQCLALRHRRPVRWLLENHAVDARWCLVHATHVDHDEVAALAASGATVCLCPSTEANLGDGLFPLADYLAAGGCLAIGSDSHISINPFEELRWLEYGQRLVAERRNVAALDNGRGRHTGRTLYELALAGGARAAGTTTAGRLERGARPTCWCSMTRTRCSPGTMRNRCSTRWSSPATRCRWLAS